MGASVKWGIHMSAQISFEDPIAASPKAFSAAAVRFSSAKSSRPALVR
ncbi:hypothetical protein [Tsukamurella paurometabola]